MGLFKKHNKKYPNMHQSFDWCQSFKLIQLKLESLILAQNERWRRALHMQVERGGPQGLVERRTGE